MNSKEVADRVVIGVAKPQKSKRPMDTAFRWITFSFASLILIIMATMLFVLIMESRLSLQTFGFNFIVSSHWNPVKGIFGALPFIYGTVISSIIAILIAAPISIGVALFITEMSPKWLKGSIGFLIEMLAAIPSILFGLWGLYVFVPFVRGWIQKPVSAIASGIPLFSGAPIGLGMLTAGLLLAIMIIPIITALARDIISVVPTTQKEGALALGATKWEMIWKVILPFARPGILGACILGLGRALGETMAVTMVIGNRAEIKASLFAPGHSMAAVIANEFTEATEDIYLSSLIEIGLLLFLVTFLLNAVARFLIWTVARGPKGGIRS
ncbi:phosphate ABC transporter permease subunit PstC [Paenibacillus alginolyticus]|uniref:Phosphate transport system permease protein n=1 Tax=Paenibacillus alginolyticus TaxID=59839 RepID=A0ABT4G7R4_9BACL|nr:phosphate ABC transporter permease subunit PstC [Paenibacillus alginolyticus]MCY9692209.1 phosphate ABC transporter permease subunit PstC [Paenibacillus alginolyticus]MEC0145952.1 phosphate ABC transporter permease subunit PstC [Paenibacillus alginolyticus]